MKLYNICANCGRVYKSGKNRFVCENGREVDYYGTCDRFCKNSLDIKEFFQKVNESLKRMEDFQEGTYEITKRVPLGTNYRILKCRK